MKTKQTQDNWREIELGEILDYEQPGNYIVESVEYNDEFKTPVLTAGKSFILGYTNETKGIFDKLPVIIFDDFTTDTKYVDFKFKVKSSAMKILKPKNDNINIKFIFYMMKKINHNFSTHKRYYLSVYQNKKIPIPFKEGKPDIKEQERIVSILEKAEKVKERGKNTEKFLNEFLKSTFYEMFLKEKSKYDITEIRGVAPLQGGFAFKSKDFVNEGIKLVKITNVWNNILIWEDKTFLPLRYLEKYFQFSLNEGDIVLSMTRPIIKSLNSVKIVQIQKHDLPCLLNQRVGRFLLNKNKISANYLLHYCYTSEFKKEVDKYCSTSLQPNISSNQINSIKIPLPPLPLQQKFARIVEHVEKLKENIKKTTQNSGELFNSLIQKAFIGGL